MRYILIASLVLCFFSTQAETYYITTEGNLANKGTLNSPFSFQYLEYNRNHAGDIFIVKDGIYPGHWVTNIFGEEGKPVIVKSENWMGASLIGVEEKREDKRLILKVMGDFSWFMNFEICDTKATNRIVNNGEDFYLSDGAHLFGYKSKIINCVSHDVLIGFSTWSPAVEGEIYGCIAYNIGWNNLNSNRKNKGHGHGYYVQNKADETTYKQLRLNIVWGTASEGFHAYTQKGNIENFHFENNLAYNMIGYNQSHTEGRGYMLGGYQSVSGLMFINNHAYKSSVQIGYGTNYPVINHDVVFDENYLFDSKISLYHLQEMISMKNNNFIVRDPVLIAIQGSGASDKIHEWPTYNNKIFLLGESQMARVGLQEIGMDGTRYINLQEAKWFAKNDISDELPISKAFVYHNQYDENRSNIYIYNFKSLASFPVNLDNFLKPGDTFEVRDVENLEEVLLSGIYEGEPLLFPMDLEKLAPISGNLPHNHAKHSDINFNAFIVQRKPH